MVNSNINNNLGHQKLTRPLDDLLKKVTARVTPSQRDQARIRDLSVKLQSIVGKTLKEAGFQADISVQGSVAKDTWLRDEGDLDIFASFPSEFERGEWEDRVLPALRKVFSEYRVLERYAEHPFLELEVAGTTINLVPCYSVERGKWKSATDRTPFHTAYMREHLTEDLRGEIRLLKRFMKGVGVYGAEIRTGGFSGMLVESLALKYGSFLEALAVSSRWTNRVVIEVESSGREESAVRGKFDAPLIVIDPIDPNRNLSAAVRAEKLWDFVAVGRQFLNLPGFSYFYPPKPSPKTRNHLRRKLARKRCDFVIVLFPHSQLILDILWGQLYSLEKSLASLVERHQFRVLRSTVWAEAEGTSGILLAVESAMLSHSQLRIGPPVEKREESASFLKRHDGSRDTISGPWIRGDRWMVEKKRQFPEISRLLIASARNPELGLSIPAQLENGFRKKAKVLLNGEILSLSSLTGFSQTLWNFIDGRPAWLHKAHA